MKILHLQPELNITCGVSKMISILIENSPKNLDNFIITLAGDGIERFKNMGDKLLVLNYNKKYFFYIPFIFIYILDFCRKQNIDIVHSHHRLFDLIAYPISKMLKIKTITTVHSKVKGFRSISYKSDILVAVSNSIKDHLINEFSIKKNKIKVIHNFVLEKESIPTEGENYLRENLALPPNSLNLIFIGRLDEEKGIDILLKAFQIVQKANKNLHLLLVGNGSKGQYAKDFINESNLRAQVIEPRYNIFEIYKIADIIVLPSRVDPFPLVMIEAGLMKKPFIGSKVDGIAELIVHGDDGLLFEKENVQDLVSSINYMIADMNRAKVFGENLYKKIVNNYLAEKGVDLYNKVYEELHNEKDNSR